MSKKLKSVFLCVLCFALLATSGFAYFDAESAAPSADRQGCCSGHGGVCGNSGGRAVCCDGTISPSCRSSTDTNLLLSENKSTQLLFSNVDDTCR